MMSVRTTQPESPRKCSSATWSTASDTTTTRYVVESDCAASGAATVRTKARSENEFTAWVIFFGGAAARLPPLPARFLVRRLDRRPTAPPRGAAAGAAGGARRWLSLRYQCLRRLGGTHPDHPQAVVHVVDVCESVAHHHAPGHRGVDAAAT